MSKPVNVNAPVNMQESLYDETFNLLKDYATDHWEDNAYILRFDDTVPASLMRKLSKLTRKYPHDTVVLAGNRATFLNLGGHTVSNITFEINITKTTWKRKARRLLHSLNLERQVAEDALETAYILSVLSGGSEVDYWNPTIISAEMPEVV